MHSSHLKTNRQSAILEADVGAGPGLCLQAWGWTFSQHLVGVGADSGSGAGCSLGCGLSCSFGLSCGCGCWRCTGPSSRVVSACCEVFNPPLSILAVFSSSFSRTFWPGATHFMTFAIRFMMPAPLSLTSLRRLSHFCSVSCIQVIIPSHCASSRTARASNRFAR